MKKNNAHFLFTFLASSSLILFLTGCTGNAQGVENTSDVTSAETSENGDGTFESGESIEDIKIEVIDDVSDKPYIYNDLCMVSDTYADYNYQVPVETIASELRKESYKRMILLNHTPEVSDSKVTDTIELKIETANPGGRATQTFFETAVFEKEGGNWKLVSREWNDWRIKNTGLNGSDWHKKADETMLKNWFGDEISTDSEGELYVHFNRNVYFLGTAQITDTSFDDINVGTKCSGKIYYVSDERHEIGFKCEQGSTDEDGNLSLTLVTDNGEDDIAFGTDFTYLTPVEAETALADDETGNSDRVTLKNLDSFELSSESAFYGEWDKEIGANNGNVSPELSWEEVEGAGKYAIFMVDLDDGIYHLHWYDQADENHIGAGAFDKNTGFTGPYPEAPHEYTVYVFALKNEAGDLGLRVDGQGIDVQTFIDTLETDCPGNIISYGELTASYEYAMVY